MLHVYVCVLDKTILLSVVMYRVCVSVYFWIWFLSFRASLSVFINYRHFNCHLYILHWYCSFAFFYCNVFVLPYW